MKWNDLYLGPKIESITDDNQNFSRYSYCLNNPLTNTDPSGEFWSLVFYAAVDVFFNWASHDFKLGIYERHNNIFVFYYFV